MNIDSSGIFDIWYCCYVAVSRQIKSDVVNKEWQCREKFILYGAHVLTMSLNYET